MLATERLPTKHPACGGTATEHAASAGAATEHHAVPGSTTSIATEPSHTSNHAATAATERCPNLAVDIHECVVRSTFPALLNTSGIDTELLYDATGNKAITLPKQWPLARPQLATRQTRLERSELRLGFAWALQREQHTRGLPVLPPCSWCGLPTGGYCDLCTTTVANPVCSACGGTTFEITATCRRCLPRGRS